MLHLKSIKWLNIFLQIFLFVGVLLSLFLYTKPSTYTVAQSCRSGCYWNGGIGRCTGPNGCTNTGVAGCGGCQACFDGYCCDRGSCGSCTPSSCSAGYVEGGSGGNGCSGSHKSCNRTYCTGGNCGTTTRYCWLIKYTLTYNAGEGGTLEGSTSQSICRNSNGTAVSANPSEGYVFVDWSDSSTANPRTDTSVTTDINVTANFLLTNIPPSSPTNLKVENATNPTGIADTTPEFKAIFQDEDLEDTALYYEIDVNSNDTFTGTVMWGSGKTALPSAVEVGEESPEISYAGTELTLNGSTYYWRIKFWDSADSESPWSDTANFKMNTPPSAPTSPLAEGATNPVGITDLTPEFSAVFNDPDTGNTGTYYEIQVNTNATFSGTVMWSSGQTSMVETAIGSRSPEVSYAGTTLTLNGSTYYWRIRFTDNYGTVGEWSSAANFKMNASPTAPTSIQTEGLTNPTNVADTTPEFSAIFNDPDTSDTGSYYQIGVNTASDFAGTSMWDSGKVPMSPVTNAARSGDISYGGVSGNISVGRIVRLGSNGVLETGNGMGTGANDGLGKVEIQSDGKIIITGNLTSYNGTGRLFIARLNKDGSLDTSFSTGSGPSSTVSNLAIQSDGKIVIGGWFTTINGTGRNYIARLNSNGSLDTGFVVGSGASTVVRTIAIQTDGKIIIAGDFTTYNGTSRNYIARLNSDGTLDTSFDPGTGANSTIYDVAIQPDGKIIIAGFFTTYRGTGRNYIARLNSDGTLDTSFNPGSGASNVVLDAEIQSDGKILIGGYFTTYNGTGRNRIARVNSDGTLDTSFAVGTGANDVVNSVVCQSDGKVVIGGSFTTYASTSRNYVARINSNGTLDNTFTVGTGANNLVSKVALQKDGKVVLVGDFTSYNTQAAASTALAANGTSYYWRIKFWDESNTEGVWSAVSNFTMQGAPLAPQSLQTDGEENPIYILSATPKFTAIHNDPNLQNASAYEIHVNSNSTFTGTVMWNSGKVATSVVSGERSPEYQYAGTTLELNLAIYYWRIRFWDTDNLQGEWSQTATFAASVNRHSFTFKGLLMKGIQLR